MLSQIYYPSNHRKIHSIFLTLPDVIFNFRVHTGRRCGLTALLHVLDLLYYLLVRALRVRLLMRSINVAKYKIRSGYSLN